jgi:GR25 family glycosyltransferase involved in LPS biosynthesis
MVEVYVINMDKDASRLEKSSSYLTKFGFEVIRSPGVDVQTIDRSAYFVGNATDGMIGCSLAHTRLFQKLIDSTKEYMIIAEDDIVCDRYASELEVFLKHVPKDFDVIHLGCELAGCTATPAIKDRFFSMYLGLPMTTKINDEVMRLHMFIGCHFYMISRAGAKKILASVQNDHSSHIDLHISYVKDIIIYSAAKPFGHPELTGLCTNSNIVNGSASVKKELCFLDHIMISENRTIGYALFTPLDRSVFGLRLSLFDMLIVLVLLLAVIYFFTILSLRNNLRIS